MDVVLSKEGVVCRGQMEIVKVKMIWCLVGLGESRGPVAGVRGRVPTQRP